MLPAYYLTFNITGKAYYNSAINVIESSEIVIQKPFREVTLTCAFPHLNPVHRILASYNAKILNTFYGNEVKFICLAEANKIESFKFDLIEASQNQITVSISEMLIYN